MALDVYLQIDGIKGESTDTDHKDWIELTSAQWGVVQPAAERHPRAADSPRNAASTASCRCRSWPTSRRRS